MDEGGFGLTDNYIPKFRYCTQYYTSHLQTYLTEFHIFQIRWVRETSTVELMGSRVIYRRLYVFRAIYGIVYELGGHLRWSRWVQGPSTVEKIGSGTIYGGKDGPYTVDVNSLM